MMRGSSSISGRLPRFFWRFARNLICAIPGGARLLFPPENLSSRFGRGDAEYGLRVYRHHAGQLDHAGFNGAATVLEVGPGRNLSTALLWWSRAVAEGQADPYVALWDVHANADPNAANYWPNFASQLLDISGDSESDACITTAQRAVLANVAAGRQLPKIAYHVCPMEQLAAAVRGRRFELLYSQAALEHVWKIDKFWPLAARLTAPDGWHSHRIDLADHGRRESNYLEMLEWSSLGWWLTMRYVPGAINRWRASEHMAAFAAQHMRILSARCERRDELPLLRNRLSRRYRTLDETELRTTAIDLVGRKEGAP